MSSGGAEGARTSRFLDGKCTGRTVLVGLDVVGLEDWCCGCLVGRGEEGRLVEGVPADGKGMDWEPK